MVMKKILLSFILLFALTILIFSSQTSCKKETITQVTNTDTVYQCPPNIKGLFIGTYTVDDLPSAGAQYYSFIIKPDGTLFVESKGNTVKYLGEGTWTLTGNSFSCAFTNIYSSAPPSQVGVAQTATATFDASGNLSSGIWNTPSSSTNNTGTFTLTRVN